jgi:hypothetical protein
MAASLCLSAHESVNLLRHPHSRPKIIYRATFVGLHDSKANLLSEIADKQHLLKLLRPSSAPAYDFDS